MAWLLSRVAAAALYLVLVLTVTTSTSPAAAQRFPARARPTRSGYLNVTSTNSLYFAFYEATDPVTTPPTAAPLLLGPYLLNSTALSRNRKRWNRRFGVIFIDNPLGSGFSAPASEADIPRDEPTIAAHLLAALQSFMALDGRFRARPLFLTGESYAGKYIPAATKHILDANDRLPVDQRVNLQGIGIGNGMTHPIAQVTVHADQAYFAGLINAKQKATVEAMQNRTVSLVRAGNWTGARKERNGIISFLPRVTGVATSFNYSRERPYPTRPLLDFLNSDEAKAALGARRDVAWVRCSKADIMRSAKRDVEAVLARNGTARVLLFQGVFDLHSAPAGRRLAGYVQRSGALANVVIVGAGHMAAGDNRPAAQAMIEGWVLQTGPFAGAGARSSTS
ncbi:hypothetical protein PVAP13_5NG275200 [Panicum virgatum]|uniref:Carboxypeptidase n=1 Tax=Panicum virgatum TaxID=38727 RepID=A0A8T0RWK1_PANVG|nr:hypothetical protein PVAP13_5NG275200 [Panicum virgatum]